MVYCQAREVLVSLMKDCGLRLVCLRLGLANLPISLPQPGRNDVASSRCSFICLSPSGRPGTEGGMCSFLGPGLRPPYCRQDRRAVLVFPLLRPSRLGLQMAVYREQDTPHGALLLISARPTLCGDDQRAWACGVACSGGE